MHALPTIKKQTLAVIQSLAAQSLSKFDHFKASITTAFTTEAAQILKLLTAQGYTTLDMACSSFANFDTSGATLSHPRASYVEVLIDNCEVTQ